MDPKNANNEPVDTTESEISEAEQPLPGGEPEEMEYSQGGETSEIDRENANPELSEHTINASG